MGWRMQLSLLLAAFAVIQCVAGDLGFLTSFAGAADSYSKWAPMQCSGHAYCFLNCSPKPTAQPKCAQDFTLDPILGKCKKLSSYKCDDSTLQVGSSCFTCNEGDKLLRKQGLCMKACPAGYETVKASNVWYCVEDCNAALGYSYGQFCVAYTSAYYPTPQECKGTKCKYTDYVLLHGNDMYNKTDIDALYNSYSYGAAAFSYDLQFGAQKYADGFDSQYKKAAGFNPAAQCRCAKALLRDIYPALTYTPTSTAAAPSFLTQTPTCGAPTKPGCIYSAASGKCDCACGGKLTPAAGQCCDAACPRGFKACTFGDAKFCTTAGAMFGADSCDVWSQLFSYMDRTTLCGKGAAPAKGGGGGGDFITGGGQAQDSTLPPNKKLYEVVDNTPAPPTSLPDLLSSDAFKDYKPLFQQGAVAQERAVAAAGR